MSNVDEPAADFWPSECSAVDLAALLGITDRQVHYLVKRGAIPKPERGRHKTVLAVRSYTAFLRTRIQRRESEAGAEHKERLAKAKADLAELEVAKARGNYWPADEVQAVRQGAILRARSLLLNLPTCADEVVALAPQGAARVRDLLTDRVHDALSELARNPPDDDDDDAPPAAG